MVGIFQTPVHSTKCLHCSVDTTLRSCLQNSKVQTHDTPTHHQHSARTSTNNEVNSPLGHQVLFVCLTRRRSSACQGSISAKASISAPITATCDVSLTSTTARLEQCDHHLRYEISLKSKISGIKKSRRVETNTKRR